MNQAANNDPHGIQALLDDLTAAGASPPGPREMEEHGLILAWHFDRLGAVGLGAALSASAADEAEFCAAYDELFRRLDPDKLTLGAALCPLSLTNTVLFDAARHAAMPARAAYRAAVEARIRNECPDELDDLMANL